ncbi:MAG: hypothetical protein ACYCVZ_05230, partial [Streptosporangiaceae bacterium]
EAARQARVAYVTEEAEARRVYAAAAAAAANPGTAPRSSPLALGLGGTSDLTEDERRLIGLAAVAAMRSSSAPAAPSGPGTPAATPADLASQDPSRFRYLRTPGGVLAIPPRRGV